MSILFGFLIINKLKSILCRLVTKLEPYVSIQYVMYKISMYIYP